MKRVLTLRGPHTDEHAVNVGDSVAYRFLVLGFLAGHREGNKTKEIIYQHSRIKKALFACGVLVDIPVGTTDPVLLKLITDDILLVIKPGYGLQLKPGMHQIEMYQSDWDVVVAGIVNTGTAAVDSDVVADVLDRISAAPTKEDP